MSINIDHILDPNNLGFDPDTLREKYRAERDRRLRDDGNEQYRETAGDYSKYAEDPYIEGVANREPVTDEVQVAVIGGGFGGLLVSGRLREAGVESIRVIEKGGDFGGTWYWNRYPGAMCDVESYIYLPLLEELNYIPKEKYSKGPEILAYSKKIAEHYGLYKHALLQTQVTEVRWDGDSRRWIVSTDRGDCFKAQFVAQSNGPLNKPKLPGIPGIQDFKGHTFHTSRWDYDYTGGDSSGGLDGLADKRVGIIGTGATAIQCVPHLGEAAKQLYVFQRTPSSVDIRANRPTDDQWSGSLESGWQQRRMDNFNVLVSGGFADEDLVGDGWTEIYRNLTGMLPPDGFEELAKEQRALATEIADFQKMEKVRARVDEIVEDKDTAAALKPYYRQFCKRPCFHDEYLDTYNRPNVALVDTQGRGVDRLSEYGVVVDGVEYQVDCLIFATGFEVGTGYTRNSGYDLVGRDGISLKDKWSGGPKTLHGLHSHGFPNCYFMGMIQTGLTPNFPHMLNEQSKQIAYVVKHALDNNLQEVEASKLAEDEYVALIKKLARMGEKFFAECTPGYYNNEGKLDKENGFLSNVYGGGPVEFFEMLADWREEGTLKGMDKHA
ncbi:MAG: NAD(P)/FAD-dependent oxidoreductase [Pseudomonadota bacterium]